MYNRNFLKQPVINGPVSQVTGHRLKSERGVQNQQEHVQTLSSLPKLTLLWNLATLVTSLHADFLGSPFWDRETKHRCQVLFRIGGAACLAHVRCGHSTCSCIPYIIGFAELHSNFKAHFTLLF